MAEDKFAPKAGDGSDKIHQLHHELIKQQKAQNRKRREAAHKPKVDENVKVPTEAPGGNESAAGTAAPSEGGPGVPV